MWLEESNNIDESIIEKSHISPTIGTYALFYQYIDDNISIMKRGGKYGIHLQKYMTKIEFDLRSVVLGCIFYFIARTHH